MVGHDHVGRVVEVIGDGGEQGEPEGGGAGRACIIGLEQQPAETHVRAVPQQVAGHRRGEHGDQRPLPRYGRGRGDGGVGYRAGRVFVVVVRVLRHDTKSPPPYRLPATGPYRIWRAYCAAAATSDGSSGGVCRSATPASGTQRQPVTSSSCGVACAL